MTKVITIKEANISTLSVELKAIHINSKQMMLSVFRQIPEEKLFRNDFKLMGAPWGWVNYFWDKAPQVPDNMIHIVWQKGDELRRHRLFNFIENTSDHQPYYTQNLINRYVYDFAYELNEITQWLNTNYAGSGNDIFRKHQLSRPESYSKYSLENPASKEKYEQSLLLKEQLLLRQKELEGLILGNTDYAKKYIENWRRVYQQLAALPQLYIAA